METGWMAAAGLGIGLLLCCVPAIAGFAVIQIKCKKSVMPFFMGAAAFIVSQLLLRTPLLQLVLPRFEWYVTLSVQNYYGYWIFLGVTAGIFEETARWICFRFLLKKRRRFSDGIVFGLGHGGAEAILIVGISYLNNFIVACVLAGGGNLTQRFGIEEPLASQIAQQFQQLTFWGSMTGAVERILALMMQVGFTMIVFYGVKKGKSLLALPAAILLHGFIDASIGFWQAAGVTGWALEGIFAVYTGALMVLVFIYYKKLKKEEREA